jgi:hypothetical protein
MRLPRRTSWPSLSPLLVLLASAAGAQGTLDHLECRRVADDLRIDATADLEAISPAYSAQGCRIGRVNRLCVPVTKTNVQPPPPAAVAGQALDGAYLCYRLKCRIPPTSEVLEDQFGVHRPTVLRTSELCVPARPTTTTTTTTTSTTTTTTEPGCGDYGEPCCPNARCNFSGPYPLVCLSSGYCIFCGRGGDPCCAGAPPCIGSPAVQCVSGTCVLNP